MQRTYLPDQDYQLRREYRRLLEQWIGTLDVDLFVTLSFADNTRLDIAPRLLKHWLARIDNYYLGRGWARQPTTERTFGVLLPENINTNLHFHAMIRLPSWGRTQDIAECSAVLNQFWRQLVPRGTCDVVPIFDHVGAARYVTKQVICPRHIDHYILANEFH